jgi:hypothetical protein
VAARCTSSAKTAPRVWMWCRSPSPFWSRRPRYGCRGCESGGIQAPAAAQSRTLSRPGDPPSMAAAA